MLNSDIVKAYGSAAGASVIGIASSDDFDLAPEGFRPTDIMKECVSVIVLGSAFPEDAFSKTPAEYIEIRNMTNRKISDIAEDMEKRIRKDGYKARSVSGINGKWVNGMQVGSISLKHAAELAGLGIIGKNYLLINREHGTLLWFSAVLTDAYLIPDEKVKYSICNECSKCVESCPTNALDDISTFKKKECAGKMFRMANKKWEIQCCLCRKICPHRFGIIDSER